LCHCRRRRQSGYQPTWHCHRPDCLSGVRRHRRPRAPSDSCWSQVEARAESRSSRSAQRRGMDELTAQSATSLMIGLNQVYLVNSAAATTPTQSLCFCLTETFPNVTRAIVLMAMRWHLYRSIEAIFAGCPFVISPMIYVKFSAGIKPLTLM